MDEMTAQEGGRPEGVLRMERLAYRGKHYEVPVFDSSGGVVLRADPRHVNAPVPRDHPVIATLNSVWNLEQFLVPRRPLSLGVLSADELAVFARAGVPRVLDMPIKMPDCEEYRLPRAFAQFAGALKRIIDYEHLVNPRHAEYHAYLTIDQRVVKPGTLHREAPCHVDGFQGARWQPKCLTNHTYTVSDVLPTAYYMQPFDLLALDERVHDFFWEMNAQVADTDEAHRWQPREAEVTLMDCYCVHRGVETDATVQRTWMRLSFEERRRIFDRLGNGHNPLFEYHWEMVERDIEQLHLVPYRTDADPSLNVFPWQALDGKPLPAGSPKTKPRLRRSGA